MSRAASAGTLADEVERLDFDALSLAEVARMLTVLVSWWPLSMIETVAWPHEMDRFAAVGFPTRWCSPPDPAVASTTLLRLERTSVEDLTAAQARRIARAVLSWTPAQALPALAAAAGVAPLDRCPHCGTGTDTGARP